MAHVRIVQCEATVLHQFLIVDHSFLKMMYFDIVRFIRCLTQVRMRYTFKMCITKYDLVHDQFAFIWRTTSVYYVQQNNTDFNFHVVIYNKLLQ